MDPIIAVVAAVGGYLIGSISFSRVVARFADPAVDFSMIDAEVGAGRRYRSRVASPNSVRTNIGARYGILAAVLDILKVFLPTLVVGLAFPDEHYDVLVAAAALIGHDWPIYYRFVGGRGETAILGALLAIDPLGLVLMLILGMVVGFLMGNVLAMRWAGFVLLIPWFWLTTGDPFLVAYMVFAIVVYLIAIRKDLREYLDALSDSVKPSNEDIARVAGMGAGLGRAVDRWGIPGIIARLRRSSRGA